MSVLAIHLTKRKDRNGVKVRFRDEHKAAEAAFKRYSSYKNRVRE